jgi:hypothetical protein
VNLLSIFRDSTEINTITVFGMKLFFLQQLLKGDYSKKGIGGE